MAANLSRCVYAVSKHRFSKGFLEISRQHSITPFEPMARRSCEEPKWVCIDDAWDCIKSGMNVFTSGAVGTPHRLLTAFSKYVRDKCLKDIDIYHMHLEGCADFVKPQYEGFIRSNSLFMGPNVRKAVAEGTAESIPIFLHEIPYLFMRRFIDLDVAIIMVSPPDKHGYCSMGTSVDCVRSALRCSPTTIAQVNKCMPRTFGDSVVHISQIQYAVVLDEALPEVKSAKPSAAENKIGKLIAENLVTDGATLQLGIGAIPDAVLSQLTNHKDLGIHSEMIADGAVSLLCSGAITNRMKSIRKGRSVVSFLVGSQELYDFVDDNPSIEMLRVEFVNDHQTIIKLPNMTAINSCIEIDLTGQVVSDSIGTRLFSGFGGQVDFIRGAGAALDGCGKPIIALLSTTKKGDSKIVPLIKPGAGVVTSRAHVQYVVTEHGIANLFGKNMRQRAYALIKIADPCHREKLEKAAYDRLKAMPCP